MSVTDQYMCEYAQVDRRSVPAQLRGNGDGRDVLYDLFLRMEGMENGLIVKNGEVCDAYAAAISGAKLSPAVAWLLVRLARAMNRVDSITEKLAAVAAKYDTDPPDSNGSGGRSIQSTFRSRGSLCTPSFASALGLRA